MDKGLVVEDSASERRIYCKMIESLGIPSVHSDSGESALKLLASDSLVTFALIDWNMPRMSGISLIQAIRKAAAYKGLKIIMLTGRVELQDINGALAAGVDEYMMKPIDRGILIDKLALLGIITRSSK